MFDPLKLEQSLEAFFNSKDESDIDIKLFNGVYENLSHLVGTFGSIFIFVTKDIDDKVHILQNYLNGPDKEHYQQLESMIKFEKSTDKLTDPKLTYKNGSRTYLVLNRALHFVQLLIKRIVEAKEGVREDISLAHIVKETYDETLANHHVWAVRKAVQLGVHLLPKLDNFLKKLSGDKISPEDLVSKLHDASDKLNLIYTKGYGIFESQGVLDLK